MIGKIKGRLAELEGNVGLIETPSGVFYRVFLTNSLLTSCTPPCEIETITYLHVRENELALFGFENKMQYKVFNLLLTVPGVGPKSAFSIISFSKVDELIDAVKQNDSKFFTKIPGLGKKTSLKIILELSQKFDADFELEQTYISEEDKTVIDALASLGFAATEAKDVLKKFPKDLSVEEKIRKGIQELSA